MDSKQFLAVLLNERGYDETSDIFGVDTDTLQAVVSGEADRREQAIVDIAYNELYLDEQRQDENNIDFDRIENQAEILATTERFIYREDLADSFRESFANGQVSFDKLDEAYGLFAELNESQAKTLIEWLEDNPDNNADMFLQLYLDDGDIWDIEDSSFWDWFRETFYTDEE